MPVAERSGDLRASQKIVNLPAVLVVIGGQQVEHIVAGMAAQQGEQGSNSVGCVADGFFRRYGNLLTGSYDCVDRIVLNAYFSLGHNPGGFRAWWRRLHEGSEELLENTHRCRRRPGVGGFFACWRSA